MGHRGEKKNLLSQPGILYPSLKSRYRITPVHMLKVRIMVSKKEVEVLFYKSSKGKKTPMLESTDSSMIGGGITWFKR